MRRLALVIISLGLLLWSRAAGASTCLPDAQEQAFDAADVVFVATVLSAERAQRSAPQQVRLRVEQRFKGESAAEVALTSDGFKGGFDFSVGERYLVYAKSLDEGLAVLDCSGTTLATDEAIAAAKQHAPVGPPANPQTDSKSPPTAPPAAPPSPGCAGCSMALVGDATGLWLMILLLAAAAGRS